MQYAFRGIDAVCTAVQPLLAKYGVVIVPNVIEHSIHEIIVNGKPWTDATVSVVWAIYGPGGVDDVISAQTVGMGRDSSEKGYPKSITQAYKNLLLRLLCIGDPEDDTDGITNERDSGSSQPRAVAARSDEPKEITKAQEVAAAFSTLDADQKKLVSAHAKNELGVNNVMRSGEHAEALLAYIQLLGDTTVVDEPEEAF